MKNVLIGQWIVGCAGGIFISSMLIKYTKVNLTVAGWCILIIGAIVMLSAREK